jgi:hypothetical protein
VRLCDAHEDELVAAQLFPLAEQEALEANDAASRVGKRERPGFEQPGGRMTLLTWRRR